MEIGELTELVKMVPNQGISLSHVEAMTIKCTLCLLQNQMKVEKIYFLGKILAVQNDYYLAFSTDVNNMIPSLFYCSTDAKTWFSLTGVDSETAKEAVALTTPLTGSLTSEFKLPSGKLINEEQRLAAIVMDIQETSLLIPRGAVLKTALDYVLPNPMWNGIDDISRFSNLRHWTQKKEAMTPLEKALSNPALDFMDPLSEPNNWSFEFSADASRLQMRSVRWPGFIFYLKDTTFCNCYFGHGICVPNISEVLPPLDELSQLHKQIH